MTLRSIFLVLLLALPAAPARAQTHIQFYSPATKGGPLPAACEQEAAILSPLLAQFHALGWTWFIACDETGWSQVAEHIGYTLETVALKGTPLAATDLEGRTTYVRGYALLHPFSEDLVAQPRHIVAHELGHITLNTHDEGKAEREAMRLLRSSPVIVATGGGAPLAR